MQLTQSILSDSVALFGCWLFGQAGLHKWRNTAEFSELLTAYGFSARRGGADLATRCVALSELLIAVLIIVPASRSIAASVAMMLLVSYTVLIGYQLYMGRNDLNCGCSGYSHNMKISGHLLVRNTVLLLVVSLCLLPASGHTGIFLTALLLAGVLVLLYQSCELLIHNAQKLNLLRT